MNKLIPVIGLEIHIELKTNSKMFCGCASDHFAKKPNTQVCPVCLGLPGALPVPNKKAVEFALMAGLSLNCSAVSFSKFDRKNYFYPDLPKGYQISQYDLPYSREGKLIINENGEPKIIRIRRAHLEEDTAKLVHTNGDQKATLVDFNRSGVSLLEIVTEPDIKDGAQAKIFLKKLQQIIRYLGISDCDMEKGSMRLEANISVGDPQLVEKGILPDFKVEVKNLNSFRFVEKAINFEIERQSKLLKEGQKVIQETRGWNQEKQITFTQRVKEEAKDYRYFPEPDIPPFRWEASLIKQIKDKLPELPDEKIARWQKLGISAVQGEILADDIQLAQFFDQTIIESKYNQTAIKNLANLIINKKVDWQKITSRELVNLTQKQQNKTHLDTNQLMVIIKEVIEANPKVVADYQKGRQGSVEFLLGQVMVRSKGQANPQEARELITKILLNY